MTCRLSWVGGPLGVGTVWTNYLLRLAFNNQIQPTVVWSMGCHGSSFVDPNQITLAHGLWLQSDGGLPPCSAQAI